MTPDGPELFLDELLGIAHRLYGNAYRAYVQLSDCYHVCKASPTVCWDDPAIRRPLVLSIMLLIFVFCLVVLYVILTASSRRERTLKAELDKKDKKRVVLQKLLTVMTPSRSIWPEHYWQIAHSAAQTHRFRLPASVFIDDLIKGDIELRDPVSTLPELILGRFAVDGLRIELECGHGLSTWVKMGAAAIRDTQLPPLNFQPSDDDRVEYLDRIMPDNLSSFVREFQHSVPIGSSAMLGFSARGRLFPSSEVTTLYHLATLPFVARRHVRPAARPTTSGAVLKVPRSALRTMIPIKTTLHCIVSLLTSGSAPLTIKFMQNVSDDYVAHLHQHATRLLEDEQARTKFELTWGVEGWNEERLLTQWEAALIKGEVLARWVVVVERKA